MSTHVSCLYSISSRVVIYCLVLKLLENIYNLMKLSSQDRLDKQELSHSHAQDLSLSLSVSEDEGGFCWL